MVYHGVMYLLVGVPAVSDCVHSRQGGLIAVMTTVRPDVHADRQTDERVTVTCESLPACHPKSCNVMYKTGFSVSCKMWCLYVTMPTQD